MEITMPTQAVQLISVLPGADLWRTMTPWIPTAAVLGVGGVLVLAELLARFQVRVGIQTAECDIELADTPLSPVDAGGTGLGYATTVSQSLYAFDPTLAAAGDIDTKAYFRIGLLYSSSDARTVSRGDVALKVTYRT